MKCLVTGVSRGIGRATAAELLRQGHFVWGLSRTPAAGLAEIGGDRFRAATCDVGNGADCVRAAAEMDAAGFVPDAVVLNAAIEYNEDKSELAWPKMEQTLRVNVEGALFWVAHWLNGRTERPGQFVLLSSLLARWPDADCPAYSASKAATTMAFRALRLRQAGDATRFKIVYLGPVHTSINPRFVAQGAPPRGVAAPEAVARHLANVVLSKKRSVFYYPWTTGLVCRFGAWMPDGFFERLTRPLRR
ncbi:MAG TPA: SDR family oxidoreductase [Kiritimatiellia bacterium]|nr:SDR family oxidoreductase [Kiritimatiellia bacterium]